MQLVKAARHSATDTEIDAAMDTIANRHYEILDGLKLPRSDR